MSPLPLPTDNLYKFCALTGVVLLILCSWKSWTLDEEYASKAIEFDAASRKFDVEQKSLEKSIKQLGDDIENEKKDSTAGKSSPERMAEVIQKSSHIGRLLREQELRMIDFKATSSQLALIMSHRFELVWASVVVYLLGGVLAIYGFLKWRRLQRKQDELLDFQLKEAKK